MKHLYNTNRGYLALLCLSVLFSFFGCKETEDSNIVYPEYMNYDPFSITDVQGRIEYHDNKWEFVTNESNKFYPWTLGDEQGLEILIKNMKDEYKQFRGKQVTISGQAKLVHVVSSYTPVGGALIVYSLEIKEIAASMRKTTS